MNKLPKFVIESIVNRLHVGVSDEDVKADIRRRARLNPHIPESLIEKMANYAVKHHHKNQDLYRRVMTGRL